MLNSSLLRILFRLIFICIFSISSPFGFSSNAFAQNTKIDNLFMKLQDMDNKNYQDIEREIWSEWRKSGSPKSDLLLIRGMDAMSKGDYNASVEHLSAAIDYTPEFAEAWNMRATVFFLMDNYTQSVSDIQQTLKLNPRKAITLS